MKSVAVFAALAGAVFASPLAKRDAPTDEQILNYALTLEHLENAFYSGAVAKFNDAQFAAVGADRGRFQQIAEHEASHVSFLTGALGNSATAACNYSFPYTDVTSFVALASVLESVGVSAYLGAAGFIQNPTYLTAAGAILTTESRHQAYVAYVLGNAPWSGAYDTPEGLNEIYSLAAPFITSCPKTNPALPVKAFPALTVTPNTTTNVSTISFNQSVANGASPLYLVYFSGLTTSVVPISNGSASLPAGLNGTVYAVVTSSNSSNVTDANVIAGPSILQLYSRLNVPGGSGGAGSGELNTTTPGSSGAPGNGNVTGGNGGNGGQSGSGNGALASIGGVKGMTVVAGLLVSGVAAVLL